MCEENSAQNQLLAELEDVTERHWGECVQISRYDIEARQMREDIETLLKKPFEACRMCSHWDSRDRCNGCEPEYNINWRTE